MTILSRKNHPVIQFLRCICLIRLFELMMQFAGGKMTIQVRRMIDRDYAAAYSLWKAMPGMGLSSADREEALLSFLHRNPDTCLAADDSGKLIGTILGGSDGRRGYLYHLAVHPDYQKRGLGRRLVDACLAALQAQGIEKCHIFVIADNEEGLKFWQKAGWTLRQDILILSKDIKKS